MNFENDLLKFKNKSILLIDLIGANIVKKKNNNYLKVYYFTQKTKRNKHIESSIKNYYFKDDLKKLISFKKIILEKLNSNLKFLFIINPFSGQKKGFKIFSKYKLLFLSRGIEVSHYVTEYQNDAYNLIKNMKKDDLILYDSIICLGGDGIIHEVINGFGSRNDFVKNDYLNFVKIGAIQTGTGNGLIENILKKYNLSYSIENSIYILLKNKEISHSIHRYKILNKNENSNINYKNKNKLKESIKLNVSKIENKVFEENIEYDEEKELKKENIKIINLEKDENNINLIKESEIIYEKIYGFYLFCFGYFSDVNYNSEFLRFMGKFRFEFYGYFKVLNKSIYNYMILYEEKDSNIKLPKLIDYYQNNFEKNNFNIINEELYSALFLNLPYLMKGYKSSPNIDFNSKFFN